MPAEKPIATREPAAAGANTWSRTGRWAPAIIILAIAVAYADGLSGPFILDDFTSIRDNPTIQRLWPVWRALSPPPGKGLTSNGRPLVNLSLAINHAISGNATWSYHAFNLLVHILAALALYGVVRRTLLGWNALSSTRSWTGHLEERAGDSALHPGFGAPNATGFALVVALLWGLHPLLTESVTYIVQRAESMMGLFYFLTLYCFIMGDEPSCAKAPEGGGPLPGSADNKGAFGWHALSWLACLCGMASKEVMVSAPLIVLLYDRTFVSGSFAAAWRRHRALYSALGATWLLLAYEVAITGNRGGTAGIGSHVVWWRYALTQFPAITHYLRLCIWPHPLVFDYGIGLAIQLARVVPHALFVAALVAGTIVALVRIPWLGFLGAWFFAILAPTSSVVPVATQTMAEHRMYLPLTAVVVLLAIGVWQGAEWAASAARRWLAPALAILGMACLGAATARRNRDYRSNIAIWTATAETYPRNMRALYNLGCSLNEAGRIEDAIQDFKTVVRTEPEYTDAQVNLATDLVKLGRTEEAVLPYEIAAHARPESAELQCSLGIALLETGRVGPSVRYFREALKLKPGFEEATYQLGEALLRSGSPAEAIPMLASAARSRPKDAGIRNALGNAQLQVGRIDLAVAAYREAIRLEPDLAEAHNNLGNVFLQSGRTAEATVEFKVAVRIKPDSGEAHNNLGDALMNSGDAGGAAAEFRMAVRCEPDSADAHYNLANALQRLGDMDEAAAQYRQVLQIKPNFAEARNNLGIALAKLGQLKDAREQFAQAVRLKPDYSDARDNLARLDAALQGTP